MPGLPPEEQRGRDGEETRNDGAAERSGKEQAMTTKAKPQAKPRKVRITFTATVDVDWEGKRLSQRYIADELRHGIEEGTVMFISKPKSITIEELERDR